MRIAQLVMGLVALLLVPTAALGGPKPWDFVLSAPTAVQPLSLTAKPRSLALVRVFVDMSEGTEWASIYLCCNTIGRDVIAWKGSRSDVSTTELAHEFDAVLGGAGFSEGPKTQLFASGADTELQVGAVIRNLGAKLCSGCGVTTPENYFKGAARMEVEWQIYSPLERKVILTVETSGGYEADKSQLGVGHILNGAFSENARQLLNNSQFRAVATAPDNRTPQPAGPPGVLHVAAGTPAKTYIPDTLRSVVAIFANSGMGSGFLVSTDGYLLTNQHVVGDAKYVKLKWSDGVEALGEVVRADHRRDVALIKADAKSRAPLGIRGDAIPLGESVLAVGTPLDEKYQNTLTKGVVSGYRTIDGLAYLQSDVAIDHGNSGGPLLDEQGRVVGITVLRDERDGVGHDINFFVPISEAVTALALVLDTPAPPTPKPKAVTSRK